MTTLQLLVILEIIFWFKQDVVLWNCFCFVFQTFLRQAVFEEILDTFRTFKLKKPQTHMTGFGFAKILKNLFFEPFFGSFGPFSPIKTFH